jgi:hypothetical protein
VGNGVLDGRNSYVGRAVNVGTTVGVCVWVTMVSIVGIGITVGAGLPSAAQPEKKKDHD